MLKTAFLAALALVVMASSACARPQHHRHHHHHHRHHWLSPLPDGARITIELRRESAVVAHPSGCPARAFCGCGAAVRVFGHPVRELWLAANWFKFPKTQPSPGTVAVRAHHVFVLESQIQGNVWQVYDANSGGRLTRIHARSIAGYTIVNPVGGATSRHAGPSPGPWEFPRPSA